MSTCVWSNIYWYYIRALQKKNEASHRRAIDSFGNHETYFSQTNLVTRVSRVQKVQT